MSKHKLDYDGSKATQGRVAFESFCYAASKTGCKLFKTTKEEDCKHVDCKLETWDNRTIFVDVKSRKKAKKDGYPQDDWLIMEIRGSSGEDGSGWLRSGDSTHIAFELSDRFVVMNKKKLEKRVDELIYHDSFVDNLDDCEYRIYGRRSHMKSLPESLENWKGDEITKVELSKLLNLVEYEFYK